ncbi:ead/Ea22-like family protein [Enterobacter hormaechei]|uniref:ead/Ea22-like family protein n=1 Tax=Enterobacter hormaechei TaxID=158836 RepID=UPI000798AA45|nr:ead/Ea22-like family protein [Enterobacter hormaechei]MCR4010433.1 ead/Ea22-like family protein [Enterobacter hormaechei]SAH71966.1 Uncharacterised protein [Enterobacter hormaechei]
MSNIDKQALRLTAEKAKDNFMPNFMVPTRDVLALLDELEAAERRIAELEAREVKPVAWMRNANATSFMSRFTTNENYAVEQWGDDAVALYSLPVDYIPACFTDERNLMHINERGRETSLIWSEQNSDSDDIQLFRIAAAAGKGE